jgi:hypothetical protein
MADNWKNQLDAKLRKEQEEREKAWKRKEEEQKKRWHEEWKSERKREEVERLRKLEQHKKNFQCHIKLGGDRCRNTSEGPGTKKSTRYVEGRGGMQGTSRVSVREEYNETDWNKPTGMYLCSKCNRWTCPQHIHQGICRNCAERLLNPGFWERLFG